VLGVGEDPAAEPAANPEPAAPAQRPDTGAGTA
jgi:hypothetical protein